MTNFDTERVIVEVQCRPAIWDQSSEIFKDRDAKSKAWLDICKVLFENYDDWSEAEKNIQVKKLQQRWKTARDTYIRVRSTKKKLKSGSGSRANKTYIYYDMLSFLDSNSNTQGEESADNFNQSVEQNASPRTSQNNTIIEEDLINIPSTSSSVTKETRSSKKRKCESPTDFELELLNCVKNNTADNMDEDLNFFKSLLPTVKKLSSFKKLLFRTKVLEALIDIEKEMIITIDDLSLTQNTATNDLESLNVRSDTNNE
ncbi:uncharacterized protein LOC128199410 [Bicyclus anynana]|uniref:Uncharacterized protein LOC128199410 n=1 Tax=Bicyclus anynana TaxID=110368 RepID=A0ABM3M068_BICAN|nr:uncharacterized protein LOC128199410 [Bicyclus anynana]